MVGACCLLVFALKATAQTKDTLALYKQFFSISKNYQQPPLQASIVFEKSTNYASDARDTSTIVAAFYIGKDKSYLRFGELEQFVEDSLMLMVSDGLKRMIVMRPTKEQAARYRMGMGPGLAVPDSSYQDMAKRYRAEGTETGDGTGTIQLFSRQNIRGSSMPKETIELRYNLATKEPVYVTTIQRALIRLDGATINNNDALAKYRIKLEGSNESFFIKEQVDKYVFKKIEHAPNLPAPVTIGNRIIRNTQGAFVPVTGFEDYTISEQ